MGKALSLAALALAAGALIGADGAAQAQVTNGQPQSPASRPAQVWTPPARVFAPPPQPGLQRSMVTPTATLGQTFHSVHRGEVELDGLGGQNWVQRLVLPVGSWVVTAQLGVRMADAKGATADGHAYVGKAVVACRLQDASGVVLGAAGAGTPSPVTTGETGETLQRLRSSAFSVVTSLSLSALATTSADQNYVQLSCNDQNNQATEEISDVQLTAIAVAPPREQR